MKIEPFISAKKLKVTPEQLAEFFDKYDSLPDPKLHKYAEDVLGIEHADLEEAVYKFVLTFWHGGRAHKKGFTVKDAIKDQHKKGIEIEAEHVNTNSPYAEMIQDRISLDHEAETKKYYLKDDGSDRLADMEKEAKAEE